MSQTRSYETKTVCRGTMENYSELWKSEQNRNLNKWKNDNVDVAENDNDAENDDDDNMQRLPGGLNWLNWLPITSTFSKNATKSKISAGKRNAFAKT